MSPVLAPDSMLIGLPPVHIIVSTHPLTIPHTEYVTIVCRLLFLQGTALDPLLDDSVAMARRLQSVDQAVTLNVVENIPHGFLCFRSAGSDQDLEVGQRLCVDYIRQGLGLYTAH